MIYQIFSFIIPFFVYLITSCPVVYTGDSGELTTSCYSLGISHPPGYPLYSILGKIFTILIPFGSIAYRINLTSAIFASTSVYVLYLLFKKLQISNYKLQIFKFEICNFEFIIALCFAFSKTFWSQAVIAEVYTLNTLFVVLILYITLLGIINSQFVIESGTLYIYLLILIYGLSLTHHHTMLLFAPIFIVIIRSLKIQNYKFYLLFSFLLFPLFLYLFLLIRSLAYPEINWGTPDNVSRLFHHILRKQYGIGESIPRSSIVFINQVYVPIKYLVENFHIFILLSILGIRKLIMIDKPFGIVSIIIFFIFMFFLPIFLNFTPTPLGSQLIEVFLIPAFVIFSIWILFGMSGLKYKFVYIPLLLLLLIQFTFSYKGNNKSKSFAAYDYGYNLIQSIDKNSTAFLEGDNLVFPVAYLCKIEKILPKGKIYDETGNVLENIYGKNFMQLDKNTHDMILRKVQSYFIDNTITYFTLGTQLANMYENKFIPYGILYQILSKYESHSPSYLWRKYNLRSLYKPDDNDYMYRDLVCLFNYWFFEYKNDKNVLENIMSISFDNESIFTNIANLFLRKQDYKEAEKYYKLSISINPYSPSNYYNLAYCYTKQNMFDKAIDMYSHALRINKKYVQAWIGIANAYVEKGDTSNALSSLSNALAIEPRNAKVHYNIGVIYANQGDLEKAVHYFHRALEYDPNYTKAANALEQAIKIMNKQK